MSFCFYKLEIPEIILVEVERNKDDRGVFVELYKSSEFSKGGISVNFVQENYSHSKFGVIRGLHYQKHPKAQGKLIIVLGGEIFDVAVDIRKGSSTYGKWVSAILSSSNSRILYVPPGFAHGFCVLSETADVVYKVTEEYAPECEQGIVWNDPTIGIKWPITKPILSIKDTQLPQINGADIDFVTNECAQNNITYTTPTSGEKA